jgi:hypothetical protein
LILCALMYLTMSAHSINLSVSMLFRILHILSILAGPCATVSTQKQVQKAAGKFVIHYARKEKIAARYPFLVDKTVTNQVTPTGKHTAAPICHKWRCTLLIYLKQGSRSCPRNTML